MLPTPLQARLDKIRRATEQLNQLTDAANEQVRQVEEHLEACAAGIEVTIGLGPVGSGERQVLSYKRWQGKYRVIVQVFGVHETAEKPFGDHTRETRLAVVAHLGDLLEEIAKKIDRLIGANQCP